MDALWCATPTRQSGSDEAALNQMKSRSADRLCCFLLVVREVISAPSSGAPIPPQQRVLCLCGSPYRSIREELGQGCLPIPAAWSSGLAPKTLDLRQKQHQSGDWPTPSTNAKQARRGQRGGVTNLSLSLACVPGQSALGLAPRCRAHFSASCISSPFQDYFVAQLAT